MHHLVFLFSNFQRFHDIVTIILIFKKSFFFFKESYLNQKVKGEEDKLYKHIYMHILPLKILKHMLQNPFADYVNMSLYIEWGFPLYKDLV